jgi:cytochrome c-type biogenesis protein CcmH/NrfF
MTDSQGFVLWVVLFILICEGAYQWRKRGQRKQRKQQSNQQHAQERAATVAMRAVEHSDEMEMYPLDEEE